MSEIQEVRYKIEDLGDHLTDYADARINLITLNAVDKISEVASSVVSGVVLGIVGVLMLFFLSISVAWWIGQTQESPALGFACVAGFYLIVGIVVYSLRKRLIQSVVINALIKKIYAESDK
jgi:hypothetical protein